MKKILLVLLSSALLFSGCSLWGNKDKTMSLEDARKMAQENPSELFYTLAKAHNSEFKKSMEKYLPEKKTLQRYTSQYHEQFSFDLANTPLGGGKGTYETKIESAGDFRDLQNPLQKTDISSVADIMGGMVSWDIKASLSVIEKSVFFALDKINFNMMMLPPEIKTSIEKLSGKSYGNTWEEIKTISNGEIDLAKYFTSGGILLTSLTLIEEMEKNPKDFVVFQKFIKEENGYFYFEVTQNPVGVEKTMNAIMNIIPLGKSFEAEMKKNIETLKSSAEKPFIVAYNPVNKKYAIQETTVDQMVITLKTIENETSVRITRQYIADNTLKTIENETYNAKEFVEISKKNEALLGIFSEEGKAPKTFLQGTVTDETLNASFLNPENNVVIAVANFKKSSDGWSGEITSEELGKIEPSFAGAKVVISNIKASKDGFSGGVEIMMNGGVAASAKIKYEIKKASEDLDLKKPSTSLPFSEIGKVL